MEILELVLLNLIDFCNEYLEYDKIQNFMLKEVDQYIQKKEIITDNPEDTELLIKKS